MNFYLPESKFVSLGLSYMLGDKVKCTVYQASGPAAGTQLAGTCGCAWRSLVIRVHACEKEKFKAGIVLFSHIFLF